MRLSARLAVVLLACTWMAACSRATAEPELPAQMSLGDAARLDRDLTHIGQLRQELARYEAEADEVCKTYRISPADLNRTVAVDFASGKILRASPRPEPK